MRSNRRLDKKKKTDPLHILKRFDCWLESVHLAFSTSCFNLPMVCMLLKASVSLFLVLLDEVVNHMVSIEILTTEMSITSGGQHFEDTIV